jgi:hypothetical protein
MAERQGYATPAAFRRALTDRLRNAAKESRWTLPQLQRQMAYDRLLERLYLTDQRWIVKGATALLARDIGVRATIDIDVYRSTAAGIAGRELHEAAGKDIGDWFRFEVGTPQVVRDAASGVRLPVRPISVDLESRHGGRARRPEAGVLEPDVLGPGHGRFHSMFAIRRIWDQGLPAEFPTHRCRLRVDDRYRRGPFGEAAANRP